MDELKECGFFADPHGSGYPGGSRDFWNMSLTCEATGCIANSGYGTCAVPSLATIGKAGKCRGFQVGRLKKK